MYVLLQFSWWAYLLIKTNNQVARLQYDVLNHEIVSAPGTLSTSELLASKETLDSDLHKRWMMIVGEGAVFLVLLSWAIMRTRRGFKREALLAERQKNFLLSVTHELRSPLASIGLQAETLLKRDLPKEKQAQILTNVLEDTERLNALIGNILLAARIDNHAFSIRTTQRDLSAFIELLAKKTAAGMGHHHQFQVNVDKDISAEFDEFAAHSIFVNLLENAVKYSPAGSTIRIDLARKENHISFSVADQGQGIPDDKKRTVFERFYRTGSEETRSTKGTGLGLYIADYLAGMHNWTIHVKDNKPAGTIFIVEIPLKNHE